MSTHTPGVTFALRARSSAAERDRTLPRALSLALFDARFPSHAITGDARAALTELGVALGGGLGDDALALRARVRDALLDGRVLALSEARGATRSAAAPDERAESARPTDPAPRETKTWVTIRLVSDDDPPRPVAHARYRIKLPDGEVREGSLDAMGTAHFEGIDPGTCEVSFPGYDRGAWRRAG